MSGRVTDSSGGVLPGVTVTATNEATGNTFFAVTDETGAYRIPMRVGRYTITVELSGFATVTRRGVELLVGQQVALNLELVPAAVQETVTVTAEAPLINTTESSLGGNVDPRQLSELPVNGRNWTDLVLLAAGNRANSVTQTPVDRSRGAYHVNVDGQQVTQILTYGNVNARYSRDAIAEFEFIANRFDATQGRSSGVQVNAITKSGTNTPAGSFSGYFRDDAFNAANHITGDVQPYSDQQLSGTFGGPIRRDRIHFFGNYEYEREPFSPTYNGPYPEFNLTFTDTRRQHLATTRFDAQFSGQTRLMARYALWRSLNPFHPSYTGGATFHPSIQIASTQNNDTLLVTLTRVFGNRAVNEVKAGYNNIYFNLRSSVKNPNSLDTFQPGIGYPLIVLRGYNIGTRTNNPQYNTQEYYSFRDDLTLTFTARGNHTVKTGGEYLYHYNTLYWCNFCNGQIDATGGPSPANLPELFPVWNDATTWNIAALAPITRLFRQSVGDMNIISPRDVWAFWLQDDWQITRRFTLNLGVRYDLLLGALGEGVELLPFVPADRSADKNNIQPRIGFAFSLDDRTVLRGGAGTYYADIANQQHHWITAWAQQAQAEVLNDGRPDFPINPYNGPQPTKEQVEQRYCSTANVPGCLRRSINSQLINPHFEVPYSYQASIGVQRQLGETMAVEADYAYNGGRHEVANENLNLRYNPATGANYPFTDISRRPYPNFGQVIMDFSEARSNLHSLQTALTKRMSNRWQASATYTLSGLWDSTLPPLLLETTPAATFPLAQDVGEEYTLAATDQRHRAVVNGVWEAGYGLQLSGLYFFGSGQRFATTYGADLRNTGTTGGRLRPDGTIVPRNALVGKPIHRVDLRVQRRFALPGRAAIDGIFEVYNVFNHANFGSWVGVETNRNYGKPEGNDNVAFRERMLQLGFRMTF
ncbi:MAG: TonB-dependent receptor [Acidobacteria bacterium]|nr:TonB-dependent receptor [Acidobacteriota bacterium]